MLPAVNGEGRSKAVELLRLGPCTKTSSSGTNRGVFWGRSGVDRSGRLNGFRVSESWVWSPDFRVAIVALVAE